MSLKGFNHPMHSYNENSITGFAIAENSAKPLRIDSSYKNGLNSKKKSDSVEKSTPKGYGDQPHDTSMPQPSKGN